jgi:hypothetical protein
MLHSNAPWQLSARPGFSDSVRRMHSTGPRLFWNGHGHATLLSELGPRAGARPRSRLEVHRGRDLACILKSNPLETEPTDPERFLGADPANFPQADSGSRRLARIKGSLSANLMEPMFPCVLRLARE